MSQAPPEEILGDIHGYIAREVWVNVPSSISPTDRTLKVSNILRNMYLVKSTTKGTYKKHFEKISKKSGKKLKAIIVERTIAFAKPWFAKKAYEYKGWWESEGWSGEGIIESTTAEFDKLHKVNEKIADPKDKLEILVNILFKRLDEKIK